jgi:hypothetical protein
MKDFENIVHKQQKERKQLRLFIVVRRFVWWALGYCPMHGWFLYPKRYRMNTAYVNEESNYAIGCKYCQQESYEYYQELWDDYWGSRL